MRRRPRVRAECPDCGDLVLPSNQVTLHVAAGPEPTVSFVCPECLRHIEMPASSRLDAALFGLDGVLVVV